MRTLYQCLKAIKKTEFDYYYSINTKRSLQNPFINDKNYDIFIDEYFRRSGKSILIENFPVKPNQLKRPAHVVSTFFLGLLIISRCLDKNNKVNQTLFSANIYNKLPFIWFLTTLFHDMAENIEKDEKMITECQDYKTLIKKLKVNYNIIELQPIKGAPDSLVKLAPSYFDLRYSLNYCDHGIYAGIYLYDQLVKNRIFKLNQSQNLNYDDQLFWAESLDAEYALAAASVLIHNIWVVNSDNRYMKWIESNIKSNFTPLSVLEYPIPYIFAIVDTIDPIKYFHDQYRVEMDQVLKGMEFEFTINKIKINNINIDKDLFNKYCKKMETAFKGWINCEILISKTSKITFNFK